MNEFDQVTEEQRNRESEDQIYRETDATQETDEAPPLAACVKTLPEAVQLSLKESINENSMFTFARIIKAYEVFVDQRLSPLDLAGAFSLWWNTAKPALPEDADFDEYRLTFADAVARARTPFGANHLEEATRRADKPPFPIQAARYTSPKLKRLIAVCYHLQRLQGAAPFFLSVRDAAKILAIKRLEQASAFLRGLVSDGVLQEVERGSPGGRRATRFLYVQSDTNQAGSQDKQIKSR